MNKNQNFFEELKKIWYNLENYRIANRYYKGVN
jgi:hypothetical protein